MEIVAGDNVTKLMQLDEASAAGELFKSYQKSLAELQEKCKHHYVTDWNNEYWALGRSTARRIRMCLNCRKEVESQIACSECFDYFPDSKLKKGHPLPNNIHLCQDCYPVGYARYQIERNRRGEWDSREGVYRKQKHQKCTQCSERAVLFDPERLCYQHWARWWVTENLKTPAEYRERIISEVVSQLKRGE